LAQGWFHRTIEGVMGAKTKDLGGAIRRKVDFYVTPMEERVLREYLLRSRAREADLSVLGILRRQGIQVALTEDGGNLVVETAKAGPEQIAAIRAAKPLILAALHFEREHGQGWDHSALKADVEAIRGQTADCAEAGVALEECGEVMELIDGFLQELDEVGWKGLPDAIAKWVSRHPRMTELIHRINADREQVKEKGALGAAAREVFGDMARSRSKGVFDASAFE
jgi:hypothetical protein